MAVADSMTILRDGEFVASKAIRDTNVTEIAELMIGRKVEKLVEDDGEDNRVLSDDKIAVSLRNYYVDMPGEQVKGCLLYTSLGKSGPKARLKSVVDGQQVEIPVPRIIRTVGTQKDTMTREWEDRGKRGRSRVGKSA